MLVLLVLTLGLFGWQRLQPRHADPPGRCHANPRLRKRRRVQRRSIAVLPFRDMSPGKDQGWFADGLTEEILNSLARLPELMVTARTSAFSFKDSDRPIPEIARTLGVAYVVEGSVRRNDGPVAGHRAAGPRHRRFPPVVAELRPQRRRMP